MSFATFFEWEILAGQEEGFVAAWQAATVDLARRGSHGSALFRTDAGNLAAVARWPSRSARDAGFAAVDFSSEAKAMGGCIARTVHRIDLEGLVDLWKWDAA